VHVCARQEQEASRSLKEDESGVESRYGMGRAVSSLMMRSRQDCEEGRVR